MTSIKAKESKQVIRARKKLIQKLAKQSEAITPAALRKVEASLKRWLARSSEQRVSMKEKNVVVQRDLAPTTNAINELRNSISEDLRQSTPLAGRITHHT